VLQHTHAISSDETKVIQSMQESAEELQSLFEADQAMEGEHAPPDARRAKPAATRP
jgi:hypothetical protein